jgi:serine/threonine protein kinase
VAAAKVPPWSRYRAPECNGGAVAGESADVYSLGVLLWELLAAGRPSEREMGTRAWVEPEVVRLVMRARSTDVPTRPRDPGAFAAELANALLRLGEGAPQREHPSCLAVEDGDDTVPGFVPFLLPVADEEKTVPGLVPPVSPALDVDDDVATVELPLRATVPCAHLEPPNPRVGFAVLAPPVRVASEPATHGPQRLPAVPRPVRGVAKPSSPKLKVVTSTEAPASGELCLTNEPRRWVVGRAASAHLVVADPDMSREHFAVMWEGEGRYRVRDLGSKNGLFVNGKAATDSELTPGDEVRAGGTRLRFEA